MPKFLYKSLQEELLQRIQHIREEAKVFESYTEDQMMQAPAANKWSANECFQHLVIVQEQYIQNIRKTLAKKTKPTDSYRSGWFGGWFYKTMLPESKARQFKRQKTLKQLVPGNTPGAVQRFLDSLDELEILVKEIPTQNLSSRVVSLAGRLVTFKLGDVYRIITAHNERHLEQARNAIK